MQGNFTRTAIIWVAILIALFNIYPTVGWMLLSEEARDSRLERWAQEDAERSKEEQGAWSDFTHLVKRWSEFNRDQVINLGLDLQGGIHMVLSFDINELDEVRLADYRERTYTDANIEEEVQNMVLEQVRRRVHDFEADEPLIQKLGTNQIQVQLPGEKDLQRVQNLIKKAAVLKFNIVAGQDETVRVIEKIKTTNPEFVSYLEKPIAGEPFQVTAENFPLVKDLLAKLNTEGGVIPDDKMVAFGQDPKPFEKQLYDLYVLDKVAIQSGEGLTKAMAMPDSQRAPFWQIHFEFNSDAGAAFGEVTEQNKGRLMAIVVDDVVISAPQINDRITTQGQITGSFDGQDASDLAIALNSGSMVVPLHEEFSRVIGASLGADSVYKGIVSSLVATLIVAIFMGVYYMIPGLISIVALLLNAVLLLAAMAYFDLTLTLPGIAGLILTLGMAVDANVLIYERIREELALGHSAVSSIESGFKRAAVTIMDANITTLIAGLVLFQFGTGPIEGFAITLSIGVCTSVFTSLIVTQAIFDFFIASKKVPNLKMMSIIKPGTKIPFLKYKGLAAIISTAIILVGMTWFAYRGADNFGVDFTEGTNLEIAIHSDNEIQVEEVRTALSGVGYSDAIVQSSTGDNAETNTFLIRVGDTVLQNAEKLAAESTPEGGDATAQKLTFVSETVQKALAPMTKDASSAGVEILSEQTVGAAVGSQLRYDALSAMLFAMIFIVIYISFRFEWTFALGVMVALLHDVLITVGIMSILGREISMTVIAALLTIIGYSLNDTIVVFDRIREDMQSNRGKGKKLDAIMDGAMNSTLSRTLLTNLTVLFVVVVLFFFGGVAINDFALALIIGAIFGTYSSIYIASPVVWFVREWATARRNKAAEANNIANTSTRIKKEKKSTDEKAIV